MDLDVIVGGELRPFRLSLSRALETGAGRIQERCGVVLVLRDSTGRTGLGEASPLPGHPAFAGEDAEHARRALTRVAQAVEVCYSLCARRGGGR